MLDAGKRVSMGGVGEELSTGTLAVDPPVPSSGHTTQSVSVGLQPALSHLPFATVVGEWTRMGYFSLAL